MTPALAAPGVGLGSDTLIALRGLALAGTQSQTLAALPGGYATRRKGQGLEVADVRDYVAGDDVRSLDLGATARTGRLHVRQFREERDKVSLLVADFRPSMLWGLQRAFRSVAAAEALVMLGWQIVEAGGRVGLLAVTSNQPVVMPARGRVRGMLDVIGGMVEAHDQALAQTRDEDPTLEQALVHADRLVPAGAELLIASGFDVLGAGFADRLDALASRRTPRLLLVTDGQSLPKGRYPVRLVDGRFARLRIGGQEAPRRWQEIAGRDALVLDAGEQIEQMARRISAMAV
ncbi:MAG: DUF58 domain-containing protein [Pseudomonadota bacterium]